MINLGMSQVPRALPQSAKMESILIRELASFTEDLRLWKRRWRIIPLKIMHLHVLHEAGSNQFPFARLTYDSIQLNPLQTS